MAEHTVGTQEQWEAARDELLTREKELTRLGDEIAEARRELPWVPVEKDYRFQTEDGERSLADLFDGRSQLVVYHFMFGPSYEQGCPTCSTMADTIDGQVPHLADRDVTLICASAAPPEKLQAYRERLGWRFNWVSTAANDFGFDFGFEQTPEDARKMVKAGVPEVVGEGAALAGTDLAGYLTEAPGIMVFARDDDGAVHHTYSATGRGVEILMAYYGVLDRVPKGRNEAGVFWYRPRDQYESS